MKVEEKFHRGSCCNCNKVEHCVGGWLGDTFIYCLLLLLLSFLKDTIQREIRKLLIEIKLIGNNLLLFLCCKREGAGGGIREGRYLFLVLFMVLYSKKKAIKYVKDNQRE